MHKQRVVKLLHTDLHTMKSRLVLHLCFCFSSEGTYLCLLPASCTLLACLDTKEEIVVCPKYC
jgi:hypothetical protein